MCIILQWQKSKEHRTYCKNSNGDKLRSRTKKKRFYRTVKFFGRTDLHFRFGSFLAKLKGQVLKVIAYFIYFLIFIQFSQFARF